MSPWYEWGWIKTALRNRGCIQILFVVVTIAGYCVLLGHYAVSSYDQITVQGYRAAVLGKQSAHPSRHALNPELPAQLFQEQTQPPSAVTVLPPDLTALEEELDVRRRLVQETCELHELNEHGEKPNAWEFFVDDQHSLVWCNVFKAASSTWMYYFNLLGGYKEQFLKRSTKPPLILARAKFPRPSVEQLRSSLDHSLSFFIVREPFERLLSAYRNKIEYFRHRFYRKMAKEIIAKYRKHPTNTDQVSKRKQTEKSPSFGEFVSYVIDNAKVNNFDEHWAPFHKFCTPCQVNFTVIAKLETFDRDQEYIIKKAHLEGILKTGLQRRNPLNIKNQGKGSKSTSSLVERYFGHLTLAQVEGLHQIYGIDFEMFGYNETKYYNMHNQP